MWDSLVAADVAFRRDGWVRCTAYWFRKLVAGRDIWVELEWQAIGPARYLVPILHDDD